MARRTKSRRGGKRSKSSSLRSKSGSLQSSLRSQSNKSLAKPNNKSPLNSDAETSPFKGFNESTKENEEPPVEEKEDSFDKLLELDFPNLHKNIRTYTNKKKQNDDKPLLQFHDCKNRDAIVQWLNDNRNVFDRVTQTQVQTQPQVDDDIALTFDMPSVSQQNIPKMNSSRSRTKRKYHRSPYKTRARSLNLRNKKNSQSRNRSQSLTGEDYNIEEFITDEDIPVPAEKLVDMMEDEYLDNIEQEMLHEEKKNHSTSSGWERIKDFNKSIPIKKQPKKLKIEILQGNEIKKDNIVVEERLSCNGHGVLQQSNETKKDNNNVVEEENLCYDYDVFENNFKKNMDRLLTKKESSFSCATSSEGRFTIKNAIKVGKNLVAILEKIIQNEEQVQLGEFEPIVTQLKQFFPVSVQTLNKSTFCESDTRDVCSQTESHTVDTFMQTETNCCDRNVQTEIDKAVVEVQTEINKTEVDIQTEDVDFAPVPISRKETTESATPSDIFIMNGLDKDEIASDCQQTERNAKVSELICYEFDDDLDLDINTEDIIKANEKIVCANVDLKTEDVVKTREKVIDEFIGDSQVKEAAKGRKRSRTESPVNDSERKKRPSDKYICDNVSVAFSTCVEKDTMEESRKGADLFSEDSDDNCEEYLDNLLSKYEDKENIQPEHARKTRTQEQIEELENIIHNATKPTRPAGQDDNRFQKSCENRSVSKPTKSCNDDDLDYFKSYFEGKSSPKKSRKQLFESKSDKTKTCQPFSESLFISDKNATVGVNRTVTQDNVDQIMKERSRNDEDREVEGILKPEQPKINILENVVIKHACQNGDNESETSDDVLFSDVDVVEASQPDSERSGGLLDVTLPPPPEFQDSEKTVHSQNIPKVDFFSPPRRPLAVINKVTSTPISQKRDTDSFPSFSPISNLGTKSRNSSFSSSRALGPIELAQKSKFSPLTIIKKSPSQIIRHSQTPTKQKSILNYVRSSQGSQEYQRPFSSSEKPCVACSRISRDQVISLSSMTNKKLISYSTTFTPKVSHLIVSTDEKNCVKEHTIKFISAIAAGIWVLNFGWVQECLKKNTIVPEEPYEVLNNNGAPGPKLARLTRNSNPLFKGYKIHAANPFSSTTQKEIENVVKMLGAKVVPFPEDLLEKEGYICVIITEAKATQDFVLYESWLEALKVVTVDLEWLSRSVGQYEVLSLRPFMLCSDYNIDELDYPPSLVANMTYSFSQQTFNSVP